MVESPLSLIYRHDVRVMRVAALGTCLGMLAACGGSSADAALLRVLRPPLPPVAQPPDPCQLLNSPEVSSALSTSVVQGKDAPLATGLTPERDCFWSGHSLGLFHITVRTQAAEHGRVVVIEQVTQKPAYETTMAGLFDALPKVPPVAGLGDRARLTVLASGDASLEVLTGTALIDFGITTFQVHYPRGALENLARVALRRLPTS
jgi:hypothetical protein